MSAGHSNLNYQEQQWSMFVSAIVKLTRKKDVCVNLFLWYHLTRFKLPIVSRTLKPKLSRTTKEYVCLCNIETYTTERHLCKPLSLISSHKVKIAYRQQETQIQVIKNVKEMYFPVQYWYLHKRRKFMETSSFDIISQGLN